MGVKDPLVDLEASKVTALKAEVADLRKDVDYLNSTDFNSLIGAADDEDTPETSVIPPATTGEVQRDGTADEESDVEADEEQMAVHDDEMIKSREERIFRYLPDLVETIVQSMIQTSPIKMSTADPSGSGTVIPSEVTLGTEAPTDGATA
ncbi:hypothetical protein R3W88_011788 [Solanum pinnatisectum]|uniref:Polyprotein protein n=1 Tax=Solanum pinnatisectum TaxID=50273 RepID=A0AAV9L747_9SOLN|nr:hypothetical protein R3W88_011788 [Solanum pinnatisectum]